MADAASASGAQGSSVPRSCAEVLTLAMLGAVASEAVSYFFVYSTSAYQRLTASVDKVSKRIETERKKEAAALTEKQKARQKKIGRIEKSLGPAEKGLAFIKMRMQLVTAVTHLFLFSTLYHYYSGVVVARLPFNIPALSAVTHRSLEGTNWSECSVVFLYMLFSMAVKPNLKRLLGVTQSTTVQGDPFGLQKALLGETK